MPLHRFAAPALPAAGSKARGAIIALLLISLYFMSYRYPFQIGDTDTSPTYSDTPLWLQSAKYALLLPFLVYAIVMTRLHRWMFSAAELSILVLVGYAALFGAAMAATGAEFGFTLVQISFALMFAFLFGQQDVTRGAFGTVFRCLMWFFGLSIAVYAIQLFLYFAFGRLPALGYAGSFPRFGGIWDDPNSAAAIFVFVIPWAFVERGISWFTIAITGVSMSAILLSQSLTTYGTTIVVFGIVLLGFYRSMPVYTRFLVMMLSIVCGVMLVVLLGFIALQSVDLTIGGIIKSADAILTSKFGSIAVRQSSYAFAVDITPLTLMGIEPLNKSGENQWLNLAANIGLPFTIAYAMLQILTLRNLSVWANSLRDGRPRAIVVGMFAYYLWFFLLQVNIPASQIFPINILAAIVTGMSWAWRSHWIARTAALTGPGARPGA